MEIKPKKITQEKKKKENGVGKQGDGCLLFWYSDCSLQQRRGSSPSLWWGSTVISPSSLSLQLLCMYVYMYVYMLAGGGDHWFCISLWLMAITTMMLWILEFFLFPFWILVCCEKWLKFATDFEWYDVIAWLSSCCTAFNREERLVISYSCMDLLFSILCLPVYFYIYFFCF